MSASDQLPPDDDADTIRFAARLKRLTPADLAQVERAAILLEKASRLGLFDDPRFTGKMEFFHRKIAGRTGLGHGRYWSDRMLGYLLRQTSGPETAA